MRVPFYHRPPRTNGMSRPDIADFGKRLEPRLSSVSKCSRFQEKLSAGAWAKRKGVDEGIHPPPRYSGQLPE